MYKIYPMLQDLQDDLSDEIQMIDTQLQFISRLLERAYDRGCNDECKRVKGDEA